MSGIGEDGGVASRKTDGDGHSGRGVKMDPLACRYTKSACLAVNLNFAQKGHSLNALVSDIARS
jgi:hypothetical protein